MMARAPDVREREPRGRKRKVNPLDAARIAEVTFKDAQLLKYFVSETGKMLPRRINAVSAKQQRMLKRAVKQTRVLGLLPFTRKEG